MYKEHNKSKKTCTTVVLHSLLVCAQAGRQTTLHATYVANGRIYAVRVGGSA